MNVSDIFKINNSIFNPPIEFQPAEPGDTNYFLYRLNLLKYIKG